MYWRGVGYIPTGGREGLDKDISISLYGYVPEHVGYAHVEYNIVML